jgi:hypothetical protein
MLPFVQSVFEAALTLSIRECFLTLVLFSRPMISSARSKQCDANKLIFLSSFDCARLGLCEISCEERSFIFNVTSSSVSYSKCALEAKS